MTHPAAFIVFGVVFAVAAVIAVYANASWPQATGYGSGRERSRHKSPPPSPRPLSPPSPSVRRRNRSPKRRSKSPVGILAASKCGTCRYCSESPYIKIDPCGHESLCKGCFTDYLKNNDTCPECLGRIDSCSPPIPPFGKCGDCRKFRELFKFLDCNHSLFFCITCFENHNGSYKNCPKCEQPIRDSKPKYTTSGVCIVCQEFVRFAKFQPCGHGNFCKKHALQSLKFNDEKCSDCGRDVTEII